jgi:uncharacterized protein (DUF924 family)
VGWVDDVLAFWFDELSPADWWRADARLDETIRLRFGALRERLVRLPPKLDELDARGHVAAVIVLDQFSRNLLRGSRAAFDADAVALDVTLDAIERSLDVELAPPERQILYMPLMHSESPDIQARSLERFALLSDPRTLRSAKQHAETIRRFGRFPYRNEALGRASTAEELAYLAKHPTPE